MPREKRVFVIQIDHKDCEGEFQKWDGKEWFYDSMHKTKADAQEEIDAMIDDQSWRDCDEDNFRIINMDEFTAKGYLGLRPRPITVHHPLSDSINW